MAHRAQAILLLSVAILAGLFLYSTPTRAADPAPIACPRGQTVFLRGQAPANESLLVYLDGRAVGGGVSDRGGAYSIPLRVQERPGSYPVEVRLRASRTVVDRFTCFVDVPLGVESPTATAVAAPTAPTTGTPRPGSPVATPRIAPSPTSTQTGSPTLGTATPSGSPTVTPTGPTASPTVTPTGPTATPTTTGTPGPSPTPTVTPQSSAVRIVDIVNYDPAFPNNQEYVQISSNSRTTISMSGWRLLNASRSTVPAFVFPAFTLRPDTVIVVWSDTDTNDLESGDFFWNQQPPVWRIGDRAELRDAQNNLVQSFTVVN